MSKKTKKVTKKVIRNYVAKYMVEFLKPAVVANKKHLDKLGKIKHKHNFADDQVNGLR